MKKLPKLYIGLLKGMYSLKTFVITILHIKIHITIIYHLGYQDSSQGYSYTFCSLTFYQVQGMSLICHRHVLGNHIKIMHMSRKPIFNNLLTNLRL
jgi:hypothetical protein